LIGLFQELGPCSVTEDLKSKLNPNAWNEVSVKLMGKAVYSKHVVATWSLTCTELTVLQCPSLSTTSADPSTHLFRSNMLFLSQPVGVGFSYAEKKVGYTNANERILHHIIPGVTTNDSGRYSWVAPDR
jgi:hypothetical protein